MGQALIDETGHHYGQLTVIKPVRLPGERKIKWECQCSCGNTIYCYGSDLRSGKRTSCGNRCNSRIDMTGKTFGFLTVIEQDKTPAKEWPDRTIHWICKCNNCGSIKSVSGRNLRRGDTKSCGCIKSAGETLITNILEELNIDFQKEYTFSDLISPFSSLKLRFDFALFKENRLICLIEYQGSQHEHEVAYFGNKFEKIKRCDEVKRQYCIEHDIPLIYFTHIKDKIPDKEAVKESILDWLDEI